MMHPINSLNEELLPEPLRGADNPLTYGIVPSNDVVKEFEKEVNLALPKNLPAQEQKRKIGELVKRFTSVNTL